MKHITRKTVQDWLTKNRPNISTHEVNGNKGVYDKRIGPAMSFEIHGKTWRDVLASFRSS